MSNTLRAPCPFAREELLDDNDKATIVSLNASLLRLNALRAIQINVSGQFAKSKLAWKTACLQHCLLHRVVALIDGTAIAWNNQSLLTAMLSARAFMETFALMADFKAAVEKHLGNEDLHALDALAQHGMFATRDAEIIKMAPETKAKNALEYIDRLDRLVPGFREHYDTLSERCHPNAFGHSLMFSVLHEDTGSVEFADTVEPKGDAHMIFAGIAALPLVEVYMDILDDAVTKISELQHRISPVGPS